MPTSLCHHVAVQVADLDRATEFYVTALDARVLTRRQRVDGHVAASVMGGATGTAFDMCRLGFESGCLELFQFTGEIRPNWAGEDRLRPRVPHFGVHVDDVEAALRRVEAAGAQRLWPEPEQWGSAKTMYVEDLDGNVFELCDASLPDLVGLLVALDPTLEPEVAA